MNVIARLEYELAYYGSAVHRFNHYTTRTPQKKKQKVPYTNNYGRGERWGHSASSKYTSPRWTLLHVNADRTEDICFNQRNDISTLKGGLLKLVDNLTNLGSSVSSTENDINTRLVKAWTTNDRLLVIWKSDLTDKIKCIFFPSSGRINTAIWMHHVGTN